MRTVGAPPPPCPSARRRGHFRPALRVPFLLGARPATVPSQSSWPVLRDPLFLLGLASSWTSHYPLHGARYCPHRTEPHLCSGPWLVPACIFSSTPIRAAWVQWRRKKLWRSGGLVGSLGSLLLPQAGRSWRRGALGRLFTVMWRLGVDARGQQRPSLGALGSRAGHWARSTAPGPVSPGNP